MAIKITREIYEKMANAIIRSEKDSLCGYRSQTWFNPETGEIWITSFTEGEHYIGDYSSYIQLYSAEAWEHKLKDLYGDTNNDVDWDDENYQFTLEYGVFENWYFEDCVDGFAVYEILDAALEKCDIEVIDGDNENE